MRLRLVYAHEAAYYRRNGYFCYRAMPDRPEEASGTDGMKGFFELFKQ